MAAMLQPPGGPVFPVGAMPPVVHGKLYRAASLYTKVAGMSSNVAGGIATAATKPIDKAINATKKGLSVGGSLYKTAKNKFTLNPLKIIGWSLGCNNYHDAYKTLLEHRNAEHRYAEDPTTGEPVTLNGQVETRLLIESSPDVGTATEQALTHVSTGIGKAVTVGSYLAGNLFILGEQIGINAAMIGMVKRKSLSPEVQESPNFYYDRSVALANWVNDKIVSIAPSAFSYAAQGAKIVVGGVTHGVSTVCQDPIKYATVAGTGYLAYSSCSAFLKAKESEGVFGKVVYGAQSIAYGALAVALPTCGFSGLKDGVLNYGIQAAVATGAGFVLYKVTTEGTKAADAQTIGGKILHGTQAAAWLAAGLAGASLYVV